MSPLQITLRRRGSSGRVFEGVAGCLGEIGSKLGKIWRIFAFKNNGSFSLRLNKAHKLFFLQIRFVDLRNAKRSQFSRGRIDYFSKNKWVELCTDFDLFREWKNAKNKFLFPSKKQFIYAPYDQIEGKWPQLLGRSEFLRFGKKGC